MGFILDVTQNLCVDYPHFILLYRVILFFGWAIVSSIFLIFLLPSPPPPSTRETLAAAGQKVIHLSMVSSSHGYFSSYYILAPGKCLFVSHIPRQLYKTRDGQAQQQLLGKKKERCQLIYLCWPVYYVLSPFRNRWKTVVNCWCQSIGNDLVIHSSNKLQETKEKFVS